MKRNILLIPFIAVLTLMVAGLASANLATPADIHTEFNGVVLGSGTSTMTGTVNDLVPVRVTFTANEDASNVKVRVYMEGYRNDISASTNRFDIEANKTYTKLLSLRWIILFMWMLLPRAIGLNKHTRLIYREHLIF